MPYPSVVCSSCSLQRRETVLKPYAMVAEAVDPASASGRVIPLMRSVHAICPIHGERIEQTLGHRSSVLRKNLSRRFSGEQVAAIASALIGEERAHFEDALAGWYVPEDVDYDHWEFLARAVR